jgi:hypothetical protein
VNRIGAVSHAHYLAVLVLLKEMFMELLNPMGQRARAISKIISITLFCFGMLSLWLMFKSLTRIALSEISIFIVLFSGIFFAFSFVTLQLALKFWGQPTEDDVRKLAWVIAFLIFGVAGAIFKELTDVVQKYFFKEYVYSLNGISSFISLCAAGIGFICIKKTVHRLLAIPIQENWPKKIEARKSYLALLAFFLWGNLGVGLMDVRQKLSEPPWWYELIIFLGPLIIAIIFYYICVSVFCKKELPSDSSN